MQNLRRSVDIINQCDFSEQYISQSYVESENSFDNQFHSFFVWETCNLGFSD